MSEETPELQEIISNLEKILEVIPNDFAVLNTLFEAYQKTDNPEKASDCLVQMAESATASGDETQATATRQLIERSSLQLPEHAAVLERLGSVSPTQQAAASTGKVLNQNRKEISNELALAWKLMQADEIDREEYGAIVKDLTENAGRNSDVPVSVMHVLQDRGMKNLEKIIAAIIVDSNVPLITLRGFELQPEAWGLLPIEFMARRGALVFERMGDHALVAILNPYDLELKKEVQQLLEVPCHFYITSAHDYDDTLERIRKLHAAAQLAEFEAEHDQAPMFAAGAPVARDSESPGEPEVAIESLPEPPPEPAFDPNPAPAEAPLAPPPEPEFTPGETDGGSTPTASSSGITLSGGPLMTPKPTEEEEDTKPTLMPPPEPPFEP